MKFFIKNITMSDIAHITKCIYINNNKTFVKYKDGTAEEISIIFLSSEEAASISTEVSMCRWENHDYCGGKRAEIPGFLGEVNGFVLLEDRCERYIDNGVIDLIKIDIENLRIRSVVSSMPNTPIQFNEA